MAEERGVRVEVGGQQQLHPAHVLRAGGRQGACVRQVVAAAWRWSSSTKHTYCRRGAGCCSSVAVGAARHRDAGVVRVGAFGDSWRQLAKRVRQAAVHHSGTRRAGGWHAVPCPSTQRLPLFLGGHPLHGYPPAVLPNAFKVGRWGP
eukprot:363316-Chlamydomonas_euryale.AAC.11